MSPAASIWFEIWGGREPGSKNFDFLGKFPKNLDSFRQFHKQKIDFSGQISGLTPMVCTTCRFDQTRSK